MQCASDVKPSDALCVFVSLILCTKKKVTFIPLDNTIRVGCELF